jgi:biotin transport system substrate-specific component
MAHNYSLTLERKTQSLSLVREALVVVGASILIGLFSHISIPLPFTPVPLAVQAQVILFLAVFLGSRRAALATMGFLGQGAMGLPVFAGGKAGLLCLAGPTGGYLLGYLVAAYLTGYIVENLKEKTARKVFLAMSIGNAVIFALGAAWLAKFVGVKAALFLGVAPFLMGDFFKLILAVKGLKALRVFSNPL